jgi:two-component system nitrogen regulation sensor histidine kinase NtrY
MKYNSFYLNILVRIILFGITNFGFFWLLVNTDRFFSILFLGILIIGQLASLIYYINTTNRNLARFLLILGEEDVEFVPLKEKVEKTFKGLHYSFQRLNEEINRTRLQREYTDVLFRNVMDHMDTGILVWNSNGFVQVVNESGLGLLNVKDLNEIYELDNQHTGLSNRILKMRSGGRSVINLSNAWGESQPFLFRAKKFILGGEELALVSFQNIQSEMEEKEMESWQKLIRVLAHEVSNSVTPITTLGTNIRKRLKTMIKDPESEVKIPLPVIEDIYRSTELIEQRGNGLIDFIGRYKSFLRLPEPDIKPLVLKTLLDDVCSLCAYGVMKESVSLTNKVTPLNLLLNADRKMLEQVLINVIQNALNALSGNPRGLINIEANEEKNGTVVMNITDNGPGIPANIVDKVFVPFFTTEEKGNGIGLSLSRRIMQLHGGTLRLRSEEKKGTTVILTFPVQIQ